MARKVIQDGVALLPEPGCAVRWGSWPMALCCGQVAAERAAWEQRSLELCRGAEVLLLSRWRAARGLEPGPWLQRPKTHWSPGALVSARVVTALVISVKTHGLGGFSLSLRCGVPSRRDLVEKQPAYFLGFTREQQKQHLL